MNFLKLVKTLENEIFKVFPFLNVTINPDTLRRKTRQILDCTKK